MGKSPFPALIPHSIHRIKQPGKKESRITTLLLLFIALLLDIVDFVRCSVNERGLYGRVRIKAFQLTTNSSIQTTLFIQFRNTALHTIAIVPETAAVYSVQNLWSAYYPSKILVGQV